MNEKFSSKIEVDMSLPSSELARALSSVIGKDSSVSEVLFDKRSRANFAIAEWEADFDIRSYGIKGVSISFKEVSVRELIVLVGLLKKDSDSAEMVPLILKIKYGKMLVEMSKERSIENGISPYLVEILVDAKSLRDASFDGKFSEDGTLRLTCDATAILKF